MIEKQNIRIIISGGGTGGHIFPAISIANALKKLDPEIEILFVGAENRMEMEKVPAAGYKIIGLPIAGFHRKLLYKNFTVVLKLIKSLIKARKIIRDFKPNIVVGVGGYASAPVLWTASRSQIPTVVQEQNSYAGITNKLLAKKAKFIFVAYEGMGKYFPKEKVILTGNPVRQGLENISNLKDEGYNYFGLTPGKTTILSIGGSLGARTINQSIATSIDKIKKSNLQFIWQSGSVYKEQAKVQLDSAKCDNIKLFDFISRMDLAFAVADIVISRAGAGSISELCITGKPSILVPSPNVSEDHQTKNAQLLVRKNSAWLIDDSEANEKLIDVALLLANDKEQRAILAENISKLALHNASENIGKKILEIISENKK
jgi:UDP-N-acetylglucosamine--N-acetylmuramyl-(pentapeptide) pyrophosphoryl-undecaprenol N-acetylglucosamine transferase